jgi:hypothetical protein
VIVRGNDELIDRDGALLSIRKRRPLRASRPPRNFLDRLYSARMNFNAVAFRRDAWERAGGFPEEFALLGDWALWLRMSPLGSFVTVPEYITRYRKDHRTREQDRARIEPWTRDLRRLYREVMPAVAAEIGGIRPELIRHAMRDYCRKYLAKLCRDTPAAERGELAGRLAGWAEECGVGRELERFRRGERVGKLPCRRLRRWAAAAGFG